METIFIVFMTFVSVVCLFCVLVVVRDVVKDRLAEKKLAKNENQPAVAPAPVVVAPVAEAPAPVVVAEPEPAVVEAPVAQPVEEEIAASEEGEVTFSSEKGQTLEEKYLALDGADKNNYDEIIKYAATVEGSRRFKNMRYEEYKIGSYRIVRVLIKRGVIVCEFMMQNANFKSYVSENKVSVKQSATVIKVTDSAVVQVIKDTIDIVVKAIEEEKELKKQLAREKRKAKREAAE